MKTIYRSCLCLLLPAILIFIFGCAKPKDIASDTEDQTARSTQFTDYYWYKGEKIPLTKNATKKYILFDATTENQLIDVDLSRKGINLSQKPQPLQLSPSIQNKQANKSLNWAIVDDAENLMVNIQSIIYEAPFFTTSTGEEAGLTHLLYVKLKAENDFPKLAKIAEEYKVNILGADKNMPLWYTIECDKYSKGNALQIANKFYETNLFASCQPDLMTNDKINCFNDPIFGSQWNLSNTGQYGGASGVDIKYCSAKSITQGSNNVIVAVIDQGIDLSHTDINIYSQSYDTESGSSPSQVLGSHGTACAGIISAHSNNSKGVAGIAPLSPVMSISNSLMGTPNSRQKRADGFYYAVNNGASVISNSWGSSVMYQIIDDAINYALENGRGGLGCVVVFATGNDYNSSIGYPANVNPDILAVGAITNTGLRATFSNYGSGVDLVAPGDYIPTTDIRGSAGYDPGDFFLYFNGTSAATPHVAAVAALILSTNPNLTQQQVSTIIEQSAQKVGGYSYSTAAGRPNGTWHNEMGYGLLNAFAAVNAASGCSTVFFNGQTVNTNTMFSGCRIESQNVTVNSGSKLIFTGIQYIKINSDFEIKSGAEFEITF